MTINMIMTINIVSISFMYGFPKFIYHNVLGSETLIVNVTDNISFLQNANESKRFPEHLYMHV